MATRNRQRDIEQDVGEAIAGLVKQGLTAAEINRQLARLSQFKGRQLPHLRTLQRLVKANRDRVAGTPTAQSLLDQPLEWHRLEDYGLPWEASSYLLKMWVSAKEGWLWTTLIPPQTAPTVRLARWTWRTLLAVPDLDFEHVFYLAERFARRELAAEVLDIPFYVADLEAHLAYHPWEGWPTDLSMYERYQAAIREGRIPALQNEIKRIDQQLRLAGHPMPAGLNFEQVMDEVKRISQQSDPPSQPPPYGVTMPHIDGRPMTGAEIAPLFPLQMSLLQDANRKKRAQEAEE